MLSLRYNRFLSAGYSFSGLLLLFVLLCCTRLLFLGLFEINFDPIERCRSWSLGLRFEQSSAIRRRCLISTLLDLQLFQLAITCRNCDCNGGRLHHSDNGVSFALALLRSDGESSVGCRGCNDVFVTAGRADDELDGRLLLFTAESGYRFGGLWPVYAACWSASELVSARAIGSDLILARALIRNICVRGVLFRCPDPRGTGKRDRHIYYLLIVLFSSQLELL